MGGSFSPSIEVPHRLIKSLISRLVSLNQTLPRLYMEANFPPPEQDHTNPQLSDDGAQL